MTWAGYGALFFTVVLLAASAYFLLGGLPLLILSHDSPVDQRFVQRFFDLHYKVALVAACGAAVSFGGWGRPRFALGAAAIAMLSFVLRRKVLAAMHALAEQMQAQDAASVRAFRRVHALALGVTLMQLVALVWGVTRIAM